MTLQKDAKWKRYLTAKIKRGKIVFQGSIPPLCPQQGRLHRHVSTAEDVRDGRGLRRVQQGGDRGLHGRGGQGERAFIKMLKQYD